MEEFRKLLIALREDDKQFNWPKVALKTGRSISEVSYSANMYVCTLHVCMYSARVRIILYLF